MKTILVSLADLERIDNAMEAAISIARQSDGHIIGYYPIPGASIMVSAAPGGYYPPDDSATRLFEEKLPDIKSNFEDRMKRAGIKYEWREDRRYEPSLTKGILEHGREADLIVMAHDAPGSKFAADEASFVADIIMGAGRPVLVVPPTEGKDIKFDRIAIGWNATRESCRAAFDSLPLLKAAKDVMLVWVNPKTKLGKSELLPGTELAAALARHDVNVTTHGISHRKNTSKAITTYVTEGDIDLLVIGAYGHSRLRERILGGVTEDILRHLPCCVLFAN